MHCYGLNLKGLVYMKNLKGKEEGWLCGITPVEAKHVKTGCFFTYVYMNLSPVWLYPILNSDFHLV